MDASISIREATYKDARVVLAFLQSIMAEKLPVILSREKLPTLVEEVAWIESFRREPHSKLFVAEKDERILGLIEFQAHTAKETHHGGTFGMSVIKEVRGQGVGKALLQTLLDWARRQPKVERVELEVFSNNADAIAFYEKFGFVHEGARKAAIRVGKETLDLMLMAKSV